MDLNSVSAPLFGGALIGLAVTLMLLFNGRVTGVSGIISASLVKPNADGVWRVMFIAGMILGGAIMAQRHPDYFLNLSGRSLGLVGIAGLLVGYGTVMGSGCTSGHGICGISRVSLRSVLATLTFMACGFLAVQVVRYCTGSAL